MRAVIQRVSRATVSIDGAVKSSIGNGLLVLVGCENADNDEDIQWLSKKIVSLRIFDDENGVMNRSRKAIVLHIYGQEATKSPYLFTRSSALPSLCS